MSVLISVNEKYPFTDTFFIRKLTEEYPTLKDLKDLRNIMTVPNSCMLGEVFGDDVVKSIFKSINKYFKDYEIVDEEDSVLKHAKLILDYCKLHNVDKNSGLLIILEMILYMLHIEESKLFSYACEEKYYSIRPDYEPLEFELVDNIKKCKKEIISYLCKEDKDFVPLYFVMSERMKK